MIFHFPQRKLKSTDIPDLVINNVHIKRTTDFDFLGLTISDTLQWNSHIQKISIKISKTIGVMNRIKRTVNKDILKMIYNALIVPHLNYGSLCWGFSAHKLSKLQKRAVRVITLSKYNAHSQPIFKSLGILNTNDMFKLNAAKFIYK